jgi:excisionase family DNA binding protein
MTEPRALPETIDADECAKLLRCTPEQVEELARAGEIPGLKFGRSWLFIRADLLAYLAEKARREAQQRRASRAPDAGANVRAIKPRRRAAPALPQPVRL